MKGTNYRAQNNVVTTAVQAVIHAFTSLERAVKKCQLLLPLNWYLVYLDLRAFRFGKE